MNKLTQPSRGFAVFATLLLLVFAAQAFAQEKAEWRPISPAELQMTKPVVEPDADAEALIWEERIDDSTGYKIFRKHYVRIKIFTERGREKFAKIDIPFVKVGTGLARGESTIEDIAARVIKPDGSIVELNKKDIFTRTDLVTKDFVGWKQTFQSKSFAVPNVAVGVIIEYQYQDVDEWGSFSNGKLELQKDIPIQDLVYYYKPNPDKDDPIGKLYNTDGEGLVKADNGFYTIRRTNVPAFREERYMPPIAMVKPYLELIDQRFKKKAEESDDPTQYWARIAGTYARRAKMLRDIDGEVGKFTQNLVAGSSSDEEKLRRIYDFCQKKIKNMGYEPRIDRERGRELERVDLKDLVKNGGGAAYSGAINMLFGEMAISAGFDTRVVAASNRSEVLFNPKMIDSRLIEFAGVGVKLGDSYRLFDPANKYAPFGEIPWFREDAAALFVSEKDAGWLRLPLSPPSANLSKRTARLKLDEDGTLSGTVSIELYEQEALIYRTDSFRDELVRKQKDIKDAIQARMTNAEVTNITIENFDDNTKPVIQRYTIKVPNYAQKTGKRMFFQPGFFEYGTPAKFASSKRRYDIFFPYPWSEKDDVEIQFPAAYALDNAEAPGTTADASNVSSDKIVLQVNAAQSKLFYSRDFSFGNEGQLFFEVSSYPAVKSLWDAIQKADAATLSIKLKE